MLQRHLDNRSIPVWSKVIPQSRGSHQQPAALSTFSRWRVVQLSGELVCSFKSVQCSTSSSKIGHLITMVAFQLHWLHFLGLTLSPGWRAREQDMRRVALSAGVPILRYTAGVSIFRYTWIRSHL